MRLAEPRVHFSNVESSNLSLGRFLHVSHKSYGEGFLLGGSPGSSNLSQASGEAVARKGSIESSNLFQLGFFDWVFFFFTKVQGVCPKKLLESSNLFPGRFLPRANAPCPRPKTALSHTVLMDPDMDQMDTVHVCPYISVGHCRLNIDHRQVIDFNRPHQCHGVGCVEDYSVQEAIQRKKTIRYICRIRVRVCAVYGAG